MFLIQFVHRPLMYTVSLVAGSRKCLTLLPGSGRARHYFEKKNTFILFQGKFGRGIKCFVHFVNWPFVFRTLQAGDRLAGAADMQNIQMAVVQPHTKKSTYMGQKSMYTHNNSFTLQYISKNSTSKIYSFNIAL